MDEYTQEATAHSGHPDEETIMTRLTLLATALVTAAGSFPIAQAADPLEYFPNDSHIIIRLKPTGELLPKLSKLLEETHPA